MLRQHFDADWAFGIRGAVEKVVREHFPSQLRLWPLLHAFDFEAFEVGGGYFVIILRDKLSGVPASPGHMDPFPHEDHPVLPLTPDNVADWSSYLIQKFSLRHDDLAMILPIHDSGRNNAGADFEMFSASEKGLWEYQLQSWIARQKSALPAPTEASPEPGRHIHYTILGTNARVNINSQDSSVNIVNEAPPEIFADILRVVRNSAADTTAIAKMADAVEAMQRDYGTNWFPERYKSFMSVLADHIQVFGPVVAPYLPVLAQLVV